MSPLHEIAVILAFTCAPASLVYACGKDWSYGRRIRKLEACRAKPEEVTRMWNAVDVSEILSGWMIKYGERVAASMHHTEAQQQAEARLMAAIDAEPPIQLYRREGSRFVPHDVRS